MRRRFGAGFMIGLDGLNVPAPAPFRRYPKRTSQWFPVRVRKNKNQHRANYNQHGTICNGPETKRHTNSISNTSSECRKTQALPIECEAYGPRTRVLCLRRLLRFWVNEQPTRQTENCSISGQDYKWLRERTEEYVWPVSKM